MSSNEKVLQVCYKNGGIIYKQSKQDGSGVSGPADDPTIYFESAGAIVFVTDNSQPLRFNSNDPLSWNPQPPPGEGAFDLKSNNTELVIKNNYRTMGTTKLTLNLQVKIDGQWTDMSSDPIVINMAPT